jgi:hypothetical protein
LTEEGWVEVRKKNLHLLQSKCKPLVILLPSLNLKRIFLGYPPSFLLLQRLQLSKGDLILLC